jgi:hypothetical protein
MAAIMVEELHPIRNTYFDVAFPWLGCPCGVLRRACCAKDEDSHKDFSIIEAFKQAPATKEQRKLQAMQAKKKERDA